MIKRKMNNYGLLKERNIPSSTYCDSYTRVFQFYKVEACYIQVDTSRFMFT